MIDWPHGSSELAERIRASDWATTPLCAIETWPSALRLTLATVLEHPLPMVLCWGPELITLHNDAYRALLGGKPDALGRPFLDVWAEARDIIAPQLERALAGEAIRRQDAPFTLLREGRPEQAFFNYTLSPVRDETGTVVGVLNTAFETTEHVRAERLRAKIRDELRASEERFRALVTTGSDTIYRMSPDWREMRELQGRSFLADTWEPSEDWAETYILAEDRPTVFAAIAAAIRDRTMFELEHRVRRADGSVGWTLSRAVPILAEDGTISEWFGAARDVTVRKAGETALRESEARLAAALESVPVGIAVLDMAGRVVIANSEYRQFLPNSVMPSLDPERGWRWRAWDAQGQPITPEDFPGARALRGERVVPGLEMLYTNDEGREVWTRVATVPTRDDDGQLMGQSSVISDIDGLKRGAEALRRSEERLRGFGEASSDVLWIRDAETLQWTYLTPAFETIYGLDRETALRGDNMTGWLDLIVPEDRQTALDNIRNVRSGQRAMFEYRVRRPSDGQLRWVRNTDFPMRDAVGKIRWIGGVGRDITEEQASAQRQEVLVNELQHRARNLLGVVAAVADRTLRQGGSVNAFEERLQALSRAQGLLSQQGSDTVEVGALVRAELAAHAQDGMERVCVGGPVVQLTARQVQNFALALHELTTNAVKYGALKDGTGRLAVTWEVVRDRRERRRLALSWAESGVVVRPESVTRRGYGTELIQEALAYALEADVEYEMSSDGVRCRIEMPVT